MVIKKLIVIVTLGLLGLVFVLLFTCSKETAQITIRVRAENMPANSDVFISGNQPRLGRWSENQIRLDRADSALWSGTISAQVGSEFQFKLTRGRWDQEAVDSTGMELPNVTFTVNNDTTLLFNVHSWRDLMTGPVMISRQRMQNKGWRIELAENWVFQKGDNLLWAEPDLDDSAWKSVNSNLRGQELEELDWEGMGWFRLHVFVDSSLADFPLSLHLRQSGASEIFLNGKHLYTFGQVSEHSEEEEGYRERNPKPFVFDRAGEHVFAVRYSRHIENQRAPLHRGIGFEISIDHLDNAITSRIENIRTTMINQLVFSVIPLCFAVMHLFLFIFYPRRTNNLFYALSMIGFAVWAYTEFGHSFTTTHGSFFWLFIIRLFATNMAIAFSIASVYLTLYEKLIRWAYVPLILLPLITLALILFPQVREYFQITMYIILVAVIFDMSRLTIKSRKNKEWQWIVAVGFTATLMIFAYQVLFYFGIVPSIGGRTVFWMWAIPLLALSLSIYISLNFAQTHRQLRTQLARVQQLSEAALEQERRAKDEEIQRRLLEADNQRKTHELEEARKLQMSMLPNTIPQLPNMKIAAAMRTATEVGGDYYDFLAPHNSDLIVAIGDATGHGMKSGTMVAAIKSLFNSLDGDPDPAKVLYRWSDVIKTMRLGNLYMALTLLRISGDKITLSNAGMPPALLYRARTKKVDQIILKSMPLGGPSKLEYRKKHIILENKDTLLLMSDGFSELFNEKQQSFDTRTIETFAAAAQHSPTKIIQHLERACDLWRGTAPQHDDITFVVFQRNDSTGEDHAETEMGNS